MDIYPDVKMLSPEPVVVATDRDAALQHMRHRLGVEEHSSEDERLRAAADELLEETPDGITVRGVAPRPAGHNRLETHPAGLTRPRHK